MATLAIESLLAGVSLNAGTLNGALHWQRLVFIAKSLLPGFWLWFSLAYSRGNYREFLTKWRLVLAIAFVDLFVGELRGTRIMAKPGSEPAHVE